MSATATPDAYGYPPRRERRWRDDAGHDRHPGRWSPWTAPKGVLIAAMVLGFIAFFPIGLMILGFMIGAGRIGKRWARRYGMDPAMNPEAGRGWAAWSCGGSRATSGNAAFDEYREDTLRRLEEEQKDFAAYLERLRFAKDRAEFEQFMTERRPRPPAPPAEPQQG
jgi:hypothetical protein